MTLSQNQFAQTPIQGLLDLRFNVNSISAEIDAGSAGGLVPGQAVKLVDSAGGIPKVVECAADTDDVYGFINYDIKSQSFEAGDRVELSVMRDNVMYMTASAAIARGAKIMIVVAGNKVATATSGKTIAGRAFDKASADGDLIRVTIDLPGTAA
jgi:hypothetical protein